MIEAMKQAIEALNYIEDKYMSLPKVGIEAITSLRQAIAEAEKQEPVAWMRNDEFKAMTDVEKQGWIAADEGKAGYWSNVVKDYTIPLYTHPQPKREPLTDEQIAEFFGVKAVDESFVDFVRAIEAAHGIKEKNT